MLGSLASRLIALSLLMQAAVLAASSMAPAIAGAGDVLSIEWSTQQDSGTLVSQAASFTLYPPSHTTTASGAAVSLAGSSKKVTVAPPTGALFTSGQSYVATPTATGSTARLAFSSVYSTGLCPQSTGTSTTASIDVLEAAYGSDGVLTQLAADYQATCTLTTGTRENVSGSIRYKSAAPWMALQQGYAKDIVAFGQQRTRPVTITAVGSGKTATLGAASISGGRASDYAVATNGCAGKVLQDGDSCQVDVTFAPVDDDPNGPSERRATLEITSSGGVTSAVRVLLNSQTTKIPGPAATLTTYPIGSGVGVTWGFGSPAAGRYRLERRLADEAPWSAVADLTSSPYNHVDHDVAPGQYVEYRVTGYNADWAGPSTTTTTTRADTVPAPGSSRLMSLSWSAASTGQSTVVDGTDGGTVVAYGNESPYIQATAGPTGTGTAPVSVRYGVPFVPSPGEYRSADGMSGRLLGGQPSDVNCTYVDSVLDVRSVLYDETRKPLVFDASWAGRCANGTVARVEIRLGVDTGYNTATTDPVVVGRLTTYGGASATETVTVTNHGPETVTLGAATLRGDASSDWAVTGSTCADTSLGPDATCTVEVRFSSTTDNARPAVLEVAQRDTTGPLAPVFVPLDGWGATPPAAPRVYVTPTVGAILVWTAGEPDDGGVPVLSYDIQRRAFGTSDWTTIASVPTGPKVSYVDADVTDGIGYDYRARAVNAVGAGPWNSVEALGVQTAKRAIVVSGSVGTTGTRGLFQLNTAGEGDAPYIPLTDDPDHDYRDPAASPGGTRLAVSVSTGDGSDDEYDLWAGTLAHPKQVQLTGMPGAERDARYSPDASMVAFTHVATDGSRSVWVVPALGGDPQKVRDAAAAPAWTPDGTRLVVEDDSAADAPLLTIDNSDGSAEPVPGSTGASDPAVSRTGAIAYADTDGRIVELAPGSSTPSVKLSRYGRTYSDPVYDDLGKLYGSIRWTETGVPDRHLTNLLRVSNEPAPVLQDRAMPWLSPVGVTDYVRGTLTFTPQYSDQETPQSALRPECRFDGGAWTVCTGTTTFAGLAEGQHLLDLRLTDEAGHTNRQSIKIVSDTVPPKLWLRTPSTRDVLAGAGNFFWGGIDAASGPDWFDIKVRVGTPTTGFSAYRLPHGWTADQLSSNLEQRFAVGQEFCIRGRVRDQSGLWSPYVERCVARPLDDRSLQASAAWRRTKMSGLYRHTETVTARKGATLKTATVTTRRIGVLATTCSTCGAVKVYAGTRYVGQLSLKTGRTRTQQLLMLPALPRDFTGRVVIRTASGRTVRIDGLIVRRT